MNLHVNRKKLKGANLNAVVQLKNGDSLEVPVAVGPHGNYQVSWLLENKKAVSGDYRINVYRQVDKKRNVAAEPFLSISHNHVPAATSPLPVRTEFIIFLIFVGSFVWVTLKKMEIQGNKSK